MASYGAGFGIYSGGGGGGGELLVNETIYVDGVNGDDSTGVAGDMSKTLCDHNRSIRRKQCRKRRRFNSR